VKPFFHLICSRVEIRRFRALRVNSIELVPRPTWLKSPGRSAHSSASAAALHAFAAAELGLVGSPPPRCSGAIDPFESKP
jgi:hypothetical protein